MQSNNTNINEKTVSNQATLSSTTMNNGNANSNKLRRGSTKEETQPGVVTIVDTIKLFGVRLMLFIKHNDQFSFLVICT